MDMNKTPTGPEDQHDDLIAGLLRRAYSVRTDVDTAARHMYAIHSAGGTLARSSRVLSRGLAAMMCAVAMFASSGVAIAASSSALPGDSLYSVKRGVEQVRLLVAFSPEDEARVLLDLAERRLAEAGRAAEKRPEVVQSLLSAATRTLAAVDALASPELVAQVEQVRSRTADLELAIADPSPAPAAMAREEGADTETEVDEASEAIAEGDEVFLALQVAPPLRDGVPPPLPPPPARPEQPADPAEQEEHETAAASQPDPTSSEGSEGAEGTDEHADGDEPAETPDGDGPDEPRVESEPEAEPESTWRAPGKFAPGPKREVWPSED